MNYGSPGNGSTPHLAIELFERAAGIQLTHVPYKGTGPALNDLLGGQVDMTFTDILTAMPYIKTDKVKALGVATAKRSSAMPDIPTIAEQGVKGYDVSVFFGVVAPKGTPADIVKVIETAFVKAINSAEMREKMDAVGLALKPMVGAEYAKYYADTQAQAKKYTEWALKQR